MNEVRFDLKLNFLEQNNSISDHRYFSSGEKNSCSELYKEIWIRTLARKIRNENKEVKVFTWKGESDLTNLWDKIMERCKKPLGVETDDGKTKKEFHIEFSKDNVWFSPMSLSKDKFDDSSCSENLAYFYKIMFHGGPSTEHAHMCFDKLLTKCQWETVTTRIWEKI